MLKTMVCFVKPDSLCVCGSGRSLLIFRCTPAKSGCGVSTDGLVARSGDLQFIRRFDMPDPDADRPTEIDLEMAQRDKLMELFSRVETFDDRASVIAFCESVVKAQRAD